MEANTEISRVTIVGSGLVGGSWAACFLAHGLDVVATDPAPGTEDKVRHYVEAAWPALTRRWCRKTRRSASSLRSNYSRT